MRSNSVKTKISLFELAIVNNRKAKYIRDFKVSAKAARGASTTNLSSGSIISTKELLTNPARAACGNLLHKIQSLAFYIDVLTKSQYHSFIQFTNRDDNTY